MFHVLSIETWCLKHGKRKEKKVEESKRGRRRKEPENERKRGEEGAKNKKHKRKRKKKGGKGGAFSTKGRVFESIFLSDSLLFRGIFFMVLAHNREEY